MRFALVILLCAGACDLKPPPKSQPAPSAPAKTIEPTPGNEPFKQDPGPPAPVPAGSGSAAPAAGSGSARPEPRADCVEVSVKMAQIVIDATTDEAQRAAFEQEKTKIVRRAAETCTRDNWSADTINCIRKATDQAGMIECTKSLKAPAAE